MRTYFITGGAGFIGSNFVRYLLKGNRDIKVINFDKLTYAGNLENLEGIEKDPRYCFVQGDICDFKQLTAQFEQYPIDYIVNFAAESHVDRSIENPEVFVRTNVDGTVCLLRAALNAWQIGENSFRSQVRFLQVSTDEVYGSLGADGFFTENTPLDPHSPYSASKASADLIVKAFFDTYKLPVNITRCSNNYGPYQFPEKLIPLMINNALQHKELPVYGDGMQIRDWLYVEDHCAAIDLVLQHAQTGEVYNVGGHNEHPNLHIVNTILSYLGKQDPAINDNLIRHVTDRKGHDRRYAIDATKIKAQLDWSPIFPFASGIVKTIDWYLANRTWTHHITSGEYQSYYQRIYGGRELWK